MKTSPFTSETDRTDFVFSRPVSELSGSGQGGFLTEERHEEALRRAVEYLSPATRSLDRKTRLQRAYLKALGALYANEIVEASSAVEASVKEFIGETITARLSASQNKEFLYPESWALADLGMLGTREQLLVLNQVVYLMEAQEDALADLSSTFHPGHKYGNPAGENHVHSHKRHQPSRSPSRRRL